MKSNAQAVAGTEQQAPRLGELLLHGGFVAADAIDQGLSKQRLRNQKLGEYLVGAGQLDGRDLDNVLAIQDDLRQGRTADLIDFIGGRLAAILRCSDHVGEDALDRALVESDRSGRALGEVLVEQGALDAARQRDALAFQKQVHARSSDRFKLGRMLVEAGAITEKTLEDAIERQQHTGQLLGEMLIERGAITRSTLAGVLARQRRLIAAAMLGLSAVFAGAMPSTAAAAGAHLQVSARIMSYARLNSARMPAQVSISENDIRRGYVDLEQPIEIEVKTNNPSIMLGVTLNSPLFQSATLSGASGASRVEPGGVNIVMVNPGPGMRTQSLRFSVRLQLAGDAVPGVVAMPVGLYLSPA